VFFLCQGQGKPLSSASNASMYQVRTFSGSFVVAHATEGFRLCPLASHDEEIPRREITSQ
jgi:hypothetical protein